MTDREWRETAEHLLRSSASLAANPVAGDRGGDSGKRLATARANLSTKASRNFWRTAANLKSTPRAPEELRREGVSRRGRGADVMADCSTASAVLCHEARLPKEVGTSSELVDQGLFADLKAAAVRVVR